MATDIRSLRKLFHVLERFKNNEPIDSDLVVRHSRSATEILSSFIVTPIIIVDRDLRYMDKNKFKDLIKAYTRVFASVVISAIKLLSTVYKVPINRIVYKISNDKRVNVDDIVQGYRYLENISEESVKGGIKLSKEFVLKDNNLYTAIGAEGVNYLPIDPALEVSLEDPNFLTTSNNEIDKSVMEADKYITTFTIEFSRTLPDNGREIVRLPLIVMPFIIYENIVNLVDIMVDDRSGHTFLERTMALKAGVINFTDWLFCIDMIKEYKRKRLSRESYVADMLKRLERVYAYKDWVRMENKFSRFYNIYVIKNDKVPFLERKVNGSIFKSEQAKNRLLEELKAFLVNIVDVEQEKNIMLIKDVPSFAVFNFDMLKDSKNSKDDKLTELLEKALVTKTMF